jgi:hypothetical protein
MKLVILGVAASLAALVAIVTPSGAQDGGAEVRTWDGQSLSLADASLEVFYTILPPRKDEGGAAGPADSAAAGATAGRFSGMRIFGSVESLSSFFDKGSEPMQGHRRTDSVKLHRHGIATQIPISSVATLVFTREPVKDSALPPYVAPSHFRYGATAILVDGSRIDGSYVNFGTAILRGRTRDGRVDIRWEDIEVVRFNR